MGGFIKGKVSRASGWCADAMESSMDIVVLAMMWLMIAFLLIAVSCFARMALSGSPPPEPQRIEAAAPRCHAEECGVK